MTEPKKTPARRQNRFAAVQFLYMWEANPHQSRDAALRNFFEMQEETRHFFSFAEDLIDGALDNIENIDPIIIKHAKNWTFDRIAKTDLAILRLAIYELLYRKDIPPIVSINEAIDLSKQLSTPDSKRFINGILDKVKGTLDRPLRSAE